MAASRARLEALLARVQKRANEPRSPSAAVAPILEAIQGGASGRSPSEAPEAPDSARPQSIIAPSMHGHGSVAQNGAAQNGVASNVAARNVFGQTALPQNEISEEDIEEYDDELIEIIDDAEVIPQAAAAARAIEPAAFGAAVDRRPSAPIRGDLPPREQPRVEPVSPRTAPVRPAPESQRSEALRAEALRAEALRPEAVAARPVAPTDVARIRGQRRELRHTSFVELLDASLKLG